MTMFVIPNLCWLLLLKPGLMIKTLLQKLIVPLLAIVYQIVTVLTQGVVELLCWLFYKATLPIEKASSVILNSFEFSEWIIRPRGSFPLKLIIIYRPPYSKSHPIPIGTFFDEFTDYLESIILCQYTILITGDFNIHVDDPSNADALRSQWYTRVNWHRTTCPRSNAHAWPYIGSNCNHQNWRSYSEKAKSPKADFCISDHVCVICCLSLLKPPLLKKSVQYRKLKNVNISALKEDLLSSNLRFQSHSNINEFAERFNTTLSRLLEVHAPLLKKYITIRPRVPWFSEEIKMIKRRGRKAEKLWRRTRKESDLIQFKSIKNEANHLMHRAKCDFYTKIVNENSHNQSKLFSVAKRLLVPKNNLSFPDHQDKNCLVNELGQYFATKAETIRSQLNPNGSHIPTSLPTSPTDSRRLLNFDPLSEDDVQKLIVNTGKKYCALDPTPTPLMLECLDTLLPVITSLINLSLECGVFTDIWMEAIGYPLLKKVDLGSSFSNLRLINNLSYISQLTEKAVFQQPNNHLSLNALYPELQSAYRKCHSTETALLKVRD